MAEKYYLLYDKTVGKEEEGKYYIFEEGIWKEDEENSIVDALMGLDKRKLEDTIINYKGFYDGPIAEISKTEAEFYKEMRWDWATDCILYSDTIKITSEICFSYMINFDAEIAGLAIDKKDAEYRYEVPFLPWKDFLKQKNWGQDVDSQGVFLKEYFEKNPFDDFAEYMYANDVNVLQAFHRFPSFLEEEEEEKELADEERKKLDELGDYLDRML